MTGMTQRELASLTGGSTGRHTRITDELTSAFAIQFQKYTNFLIFLDELRHLFEETIERLCGHCTVVNDNLHSCMEQMISSISELGNRISD